MFWATAAPTPMRLMAAMIAQLKRCLVQNTIIFDVNLFNLTGP